MNSDVYTWIYESALWPTWEGLIRRRPTLRYLQRLQQSQYYSLDQLRSLQFEELSKLLTHAYANVPYYRSRFDEVGVRPEHVRSLSDLGLLPTLSRADAMASYEGRQSIAEPRVHIHKMTSGSTAQPLEFGYDKNSEHWRHAIRWRGYGWTGYRMGEPALHYWGSLDALYTPHWKKKLKVSVDRAFRRETYVDSTPRSPEDMDRVLSFIERRRPSVLICYAQAGAALARHILENGRRRFTELRVICGGERLFDADRNVLEKAFGPHVFETYGSREVMLMAAECEAHEGLHTSMENLIVEVLVREGTRFRPAEPGETGEVAITDLHNYGMPFIRYLCGDLAVWHEPKRCRCGRALLRLRSIEGRKNDTLHDRDGNAVDALFFNVMFSVLADKVRHFQVIQHTDGSLDLKIVPTKSFDEAILTSVRNNCSKFLKGIDTHIQLVDQIAVDRNGKLRMVVVE